ncbi:MAG: hypothetical protein Q9213_006491 [Squamulea squamosa]
MDKTFRRSIDLNGNPGNAQLVVAIIFGILATLSVILRYVSRRISRVYLSMNDYSIFVALVCCRNLLAMEHGADRALGGNFDPGHRYHHQYVMSCHIISVLRLIIQGVVAGGAGLSKHRLSSNEIRIFWKTMFAIIISWPVAQSMTKISILLFYIQLFPTKVFRIAAYSLIVVVTVWMIQQVLAILLLCRPISINWDVSVTGTCGNVAANCMAGAGVNTLTDILILILPMPIIWHLHVPLRNKLILSLIFGFGSLICIISIIRLKSLLFYSTAPMMIHLDSDGPLNNKMPILYTILECCLGVICACVIIMKPIFTNTKFFNSLSKKFSSWNSSSGGSSEAMAAAKGRGATWEVKEQTIGLKEIRIMKTCEIDIEAEAAVAAEESRERLDERETDENSRATVNTRPGSESTIETSSKWSRRLEGEIQKVGSF